MPTTTATTWTAEVTCRVLQTETRTIEIQFAEPVTEEQFQAVLANYAEDPDGPGFDDVPALVNVETHDSWMLSEDECDIVEFDLTTAQPA